MRFSADNLTLTVGSYIVKVMKTKTRKVIGRPPLPPGQKATPLYLFLTPARREAAERCGPTAAKGIYALLDIAQQNMAFCAKVRAQDGRARNGNSEA